MKKIENVKKQQKKIERFKDELEGGKSHKSGQIDEKSALENKDNSDNDMEQQKSLMDVASFATFKKKSTEGILSQVQTDLQMSDKIKKNVTHLDEELRSEFEREEMEESVFDEKHIQKCFFLYFTFLVKKAIEKNHKDVNLRLLLSSIEKNNLGNQFKAIFELMKCELNQPSLQQQFTIFRRKVEIEGHLIQNHLRDSQKFGSGLIDVTKVYNQEKLFQKFLLHEYLIVQQSIGFWKELLQKEQSSTAINDKGVNISRSFFIIQDLAEEYEIIAPNDMKFQFRYGLFLLKVMNNDCDAFEYFRKLQFTFDGKLSKRLAAGTQVSSSANEVGSFGENTASVICMISATSTSIGKIIHINNEVEFMLGFKVTDLMGENVSCLMPQVIGQFHEKFIQKYLETAKPRMMAGRNQLFAVSKAGYLVEVAIIIKVHPEINGRIVFIGFLQKSQGFTLIQPPKQEYENFPYYYILTDQDRYIQNVSEGLYYELGLNSKFFVQNSQSSSNLMKINTLCQKLDDQESYFMMEYDVGTPVRFDTSEILEKVELEKLNQDEILEVRSNIGKYDIWMQIKKWTIHPRYCTVYLYRLIVMKRVGAHTVLTFSDINTNQNKHLDSSQAEDNTTKNVEGVADSTTFCRESAISGSVIQNNSASISSATQSNTSQSLDGIVRDFKKKLSDRKMPSTLVFLNRLILLIVLGTILLASVGYHILTIDILDLVGENEHNLMSERRTLEYVELGLTSRSLVNSANYLEFQRYELESLNKLSERYEFLVHFIQLQASNLEEVHEFLTQQRVTNDAGNDEEQNRFEYQPINLFKWDSNGMTSYQLPYRVAFFQFLNYIQMLNNTGQNTLYLPDEIIQTEPQNDLTLKSKNPNSIQSLAYHLISNGLRSIRVKTRQSTEFQQISATTNISQYPFFILMLVAISIACLSLAAVLFQLKKIENIQKMILSLYALLSLEHVEMIHFNCLQYLMLLDQYSLLELLNSKNPLNQTTFNSITSGYHDIPAEANDELSEEEKEEINFKAYVINKAKKVPSRVKGGTKTSYLREGNQVEDSQKKFYSELVKKSQKETKYLYDIRTSMSKKEIAKTTAVIAKGKTMKEDPAKKLSGSPPPIRKQKSKQKKMARRFEVKDAEKVVQKEMSSEEEEEKSQEAESERNMIKEKKLNKKKKNKPKNALDIEDPKKEEESAEKQEENRKQKFIDSLRTQNSAIKLGSLVVALIFSTYFIVTYFFHEYFKEQLQIQLDSIPFFFNRYRYMMMTYALLRERIIFNNSLTSFEPVPGYGHNLDNYYHDLQVENDKKILNLKINRIPILDKMVNFAADCDSEHFCSKIIGQTNMLDESDKITIKETTYNIQNSIYTFQVRAIIRMCIAAFNGDIQTLKTLRSRGLDLSSHDYDQRSPLYYAVRGNQAQATDYLIKQKVNVNQIDRWGGTPLNYASPNSTIEKLLIQNNAKRGISQKLSAPLLNNITENEFKLFYAASHGNYQAIEPLLQQGARINIQDIDGRTYLHLASSENQLEASKLLVSKGIDPTIIDARGDDAVTNAIQWHHTKIHEYLDSIMVETIVINYCSKFADGIFAQGMHSALGTYRKKFLDLQIKINQTNSYAKRMSLLQGTRYENQLGNETSYNDSTLFTYFQAQELYISRILDGMIDNIVVSYTEFTNSYSVQTQSIFIVFILILLVILVVLRSIMLSKMRKSVYETRGIFNLIPSQFYDQNRYEIEAVIKKMKD